MRVLKPPGKPARLRRWQRPDRIASEECCTLGAGLKRHTAIFGARALSPGRRGELLAPLPKFLPPGAEFRRPSAVPAAPTPFTDFLYLEPAGGPHGGGLERD